MLLLVDRCLIFVALTGCPKMGDLLSVKPAVSLTVLPFRTPVNGSRPWCWAVSRLGALWRKRWPRAKGLILPASHARHLTSDRRFHKINVIRPPSCGQEKVWILSMTKVTNDAQPDGRVNKFYFIAWRWHFYAGIYVIPFMMVLAATGLAMLWISWGQGSTGAERL